MVTGSLLVSRLFAALVACGLGSAALAQTEAPHPYYGSLISTQTASGSAALQFTNLPTATYSKFFLNCSGVEPATNGVNFVYQVGEGATPTWEAAGYYGSYLYSFNGSTGASVFSNAGLFSLQLAGSVSNTSSSLTLQLWISNLTSTTDVKPITFISGYEDTGPTHNSASGGGSYANDVNAVTAIRVLFSSGNVALGACSLYGSN
jgi:hypothetical protein